MFSIGVLLFLTLFVINAIIVPVRSSGYRCDKYAEFGDFTHQVSLRNSHYEHRCAGSLISDRWAVSTALCSVDSAIVLMAVGVFTLEEADIYLVENVKIHEQFNRSSGEHDIGLYRSNREIQLSQFAQPIPYLSVNLDVCGDSLIALGWPYIDSLQYRNFALTYLNVTGIKDEECHRLLQNTDYYGPTFHSTSMCATSEYTSMQCNFNSCDTSLMGSPILFSGHRVLLGFLEYNGNCGNGGPMIITRISNYADWIVQNTNVEGVDMI